MDEMVSVVHLSFNVRRKRLMLLQLNYF